MILPAPMCEKDVRRSDKSQVTMMNRTTIQYYLFKTASWSFIVMSQYDSSLHDILNLIRKTWSGHEIDHIWFFDTDKSINWIFLGQFLPKQIIHSPRKLLSKCFRASMRSWWPIVYAQLKVNLSTRGQQISESWRNEDLARGRNDHVIVLQVNTRKNSMYQVCVKMKRRKHCMSYNMSEYYTTANGMSKVKACLTLSY